jgi:hypothetical protein
VVGDEFLVEVVRACDRQEVFDMGGEKKVPGCPSPEEGHKPQGVVREKRRRSLIVEDGDAVLPENVRGQVLAPASVGGGKKVSFGVAAYMHAAPFGLGSYLFPVRNVTAPQDAAALEDVDVGTEIRGIVMDRAGESAHGGILAMTVNLFLFNSSSWPTRPWHSVQACAEKGKGLTPMQWHAGRPARLRNAKSASDRGRQSRGAFLR